jgi:hypothetical protein
MAKDYSSLIVLAGVGALGYYGYQQGWFANLFPAAAAPGSSAPPVPPTCNAPSVLTNGVCVTPAITSGTNPPLQQQSSPPPAPPVTTPPAPSTSGLTTQGSLAALALAAQAASEGLPNAGTATLNADQWNYYYGHVPSFVPSVNGAAVNTSSLFDLDHVFFPNGRPANNASYTQYTAGQFIAALQNAGASWPGLQGISGFGNYYGIPAGLIHGGY